MSNFRWWAFWRRLAYGTGFVTFWLLGGLLVFYTSFYQPANCFDGKLNGTEVEIDAGGTCVRVANSQVIQPTVLWANSFAVTTGQYNAVAYIDNRNVTIGTPELAYTFTFYNDAAVVGTRSGTTVLPPNSSYPIFEGRIFTDGVPITSTELTFAPIDLWLPTEASGSMYKTNDLNLLSVDTRPRLQATLENSSVQNASNIEVVATIFSDGGTAVAASQTYIESFPARSTKDIVFTWPNSIAKTVRSCSIPTSVILGIDLSGSMNNDQATPPQPLTDALAAARSFVNSLQEEDKVGLVSFASNASLAQNLTEEHAAVVQELATLRITSAEETGYTNTSQAFDLAETELASARHSENARRAFVLLTDGLPTAPGTQDIVSKTKAAAAQLIESGADVYVIGLGEQVDQSFVRSIASGPSKAYLAPTRADLDEIYAAITASLCEVGPTKIEVVAKPAPNFAPLR